MRIRRIDYKGGTFTYAQRIAVTDIMQGGQSDYMKMKAMWRELYGWSARWMLPRRRAKEFARMLEGFGYWAELEQRTLKYEPSEEQKRAGITDYMKAVGDMGTIKAMAKAYCCDPDTILTWEWAKVYGILLTDLEEYRFEERLREQYKKKK